MNKPLEYKLTKLSPFGLMVEPLEIAKKIQDLEIENLRQLFREEQLILLRGFKTFENSNEFSDYCERWGEVSIWPFGKVLELIEQEDPKDHIFDHSYVPMHWDGMYRLQVPEYQIFHCNIAPLDGHGGRTTFSNTNLVLKNATAKDRELWNKATGIYEREMEFYNSKVVAPIISKHPYRDMEVIRYNEPPSEDKGHFVNPPNLKFLSGDDEMDMEFHRSLKEALYKPSNFYAHEWKNGDIVIADNFTLLHGREEFISKSPRHLRRVQVLSNPPLENPHLETYK